MDTYLKAPASLNKRFFAVVASAVMLSIALTHQVQAQVPGICTAPDGSQWLEVPSILDQPVFVDSQPTNSFSTTSPIATSPRTAEVSSDRSQSAMASTPFADEVPKASVANSDEDVLRQWIKNRKDPVTVQAHTVALSRLANNSLPQSNPTIGLPAQNHGFAAPPVHGAPSVHGTPPSHGAPPANGTPLTGGAFSPHSLPSQQASNVPNSNAYQPTSFSPHRQASLSRLQNNDNDDLLGGAATAPSNADPLSGMGPDAENAPGQAKPKTDKGQPEYPPGVDPHWEVFANDRYPSANKCAKCHQQIYDEWRVSAHAYSAISPMFNRFEQKITELTRGTVGTFCMRCHAPVATQVDFPRDAPMFQGSVVFREGITCIACHRVVERYGRVNGERRIETGSEFDPVVGTLGGEGVQAVLADRENYKVKVDPNDKRPLQPMHQGAIQFEQLTDSSFCAGCHQVVVQPGIALEIVYQQYRQGPACKKGVSCQDCHMGAVPGKALGYTESAAAVVNEKAVNTTRKHANHVFYGPSISLAHPGLFPHNEKSLRWSPDAWLQFDHRLGWGRDDFENELRAGRIHAQFPEVWKNAQERRDARKVVDENQKLLAYKRKTAEQILENGSRIDGPFFKGDAKAGQNLHFHYVVTNTSEGHNMPSGSLGAQPQLWLNVVLIGPDGNRVWETGDLDSNGDLRDLHSLDVRAKKIPHDPQLVNFQTKFLITNAKGTEREMYLPVNVDVDPLPFFRPGTVPYTVLNHPPLIRMEAHSIPPLDSRIAKYTIPSHVLKTPGTYRLSVRMRSRVEPPYFLLFCEGTPDMLTTLNESILDVHPFSTEFVVQ